MEEGCVVCGYIIILLYELRTGRAGKEGGIVE